MDVAESSLLDFVFAPLLRQVGPKDKQVEKKNMSIQVGEEKFTPSVDLAAKSLLHLAFLRQVDMVSESLHRDHVVYNALRRYEQFWLPLKARHKGNDLLLPPLDVHWVWHVHMLCPRLYASDCQRLIECIPDHTFLPTELSERAEIAAQVIWTAMYPEEPFHVDYDTIDPSTTYEKTIGYDIMAASRRQMVCYYSVSLPHYKDSMFVETSLERYLKFINLKRLNKTVYLVPMYDIDMVWHTHQLCPHAYRNDSNRWLGYVLDHDDSTTDRSPESKLTVCSEHTRTLWWDTYGEPLIIPGVNFRGETSRGRLQRITLDSVSSIMPKEVTVRVEKVTLSGVKDSCKVYGKITVHGLSKKINQSKSSASYELKKTRSPYEWSKPQPGGLLAFKLNTSSWGNIDLKLSKKDGGLLKMGGGQALVDCRFKPASYIEALGAACQTDAAPFVMKETTPEGLTAEVTCSAFNMRHLPTCFELTECGAFQRYVFRPDTIKQMFGPIPVPRIPHGVENICFIANHVFKNQQKDMKFDVHVIHSLAMRMSVIHVYHENKLVVVSHLIGPEQLPAPKQLAPMHDWMALDEEQGERAMLIKNAAGDWGIVKASWRDYKIGRPPDEEDFFGVYDEERLRAFRRRRQADRLGLNHSASGIAIDDHFYRFEGDDLLPEDHLIHGDPGYLKITYMELAKNGVFNCSVLDHNPYGTERERVFKLFQSEVNLATAEVEISGECVHVAENLAAAMSAVVLFVLCEPRPSDRPDADRKANAHKEPNLTFRGERPIEYHKAHLYRIILAAGYEVETPSNSWLYWLSVAESSNRGESTTNFRHVYCPWNPDGEFLHIDDDILYGGAGGCGGCSAACGGAGAACGAVGITKSLSKRKKSFYANFDD